MTAQPPPTERPSLESARRGSWKSWLLQEWGLLILAAVLAIIIWEITSTNVISEQRIEGVRVELEIADEHQSRIAAVLDDPAVRVDIAMECSERERNAVLAALTETGGGTPLLRLRVSPEIADANESRVLVDGIDAWLWPVANAAEIDMRATFPGGRVYRIEGLQQVEIRMPPTTPDREELGKLGYALKLLDAGSSAATEIQVTPAFIELLAPRALLAPGDGPAVMTPDAIDLSALLADDGARTGSLQTFELSFTQWRKAAELRGTVQEVTERRVAHYRESLPPFKASAKLALVRTATLTETHRIEVLLDPKYEWDYDGPAPDVIRDATPMQFTGTLTGPADALAEIKANKDQWTWAIWVSEPDEKDGGWPTAGAMSDAEASVRKNVPARIVWVPKDSTWIERGVRFDPQPGEDEFSVKIWLRKKSGGG